MVGHYHYENIENLEYGDKPMIVLIFLIVLKKSFGGENQV